MRVEIVMRPESRRKLANWLNIQVVRQPNSDVEVLIDRTGMHLSCGEVRLDLPPIAVREQVGEARY